MTAHHTRFLKPLYVTENPLRALGAEAARIEKEEGVGLVRCNVGDPTGPTLDEANFAMSQYFLTRPKGTGYTDHTGEPSLRAKAAEILAKVGRLPPGTFDVDKVFCVPGGTGGLNTALSIFEEDEAQVLVTDPFYPPWDPITARNHMNMIRFPLRAEDDYLLNEDILREKMKAARADKPLVLMYHYPHNPTGKTLTEADAKKLGGILNRLTAEFPNLYLIQEDLYLATVRSDLGVYTPMQFLSDDALERTILVHSPSKEGHGQDRGALVATPSATIAKYIRGTTAFSYLGTATSSLLGTVVTLDNIAEGLDPQPVGKNDVSHRYETANYYQERMAAIGQGFIDLEATLGVKMLDSGIPEGTYYLYPRLDCLKGVTVPHALQDSLQIADEYKGSAPETIQTASDIMHVFARAHRIGFMPIMVTPGQFFTDNNDELRIRIAAVDRDPTRLNEAANTIKGVIGTLLGLDLKKLGVKIRTTEELKREFPPVPAAATAIAISTAKAAPPPAPV
ncbi:MAG: aminotransferase class I/II-fold pyridoxal phosphate-dependent enzyme [Alphaproteobacteria bacterium]